MLVQSVKMHISNFQLAVLVNTLEYYQVNEPKAGDLKAQMFYFLGRKAYRRAQAQRLKKKAKNKFSFHTDEAYVILQTLQNITWPADQIFENNTADMIVSTIHKQLTT